MTRGGTSSSRPAPGPARRCACRSGGHEEVRRGSCGPRSWCSPGARTWLRWRRCGRPARVRRLLAHEGVCLAEVCEDEVRAFEQLGSRGQLAWREWEVELVDGGADLLDRVDAVMDSRRGRGGAGTLEAGSRAGGPCHPAAGPPRPRKKGPAGALLQARVQEQLAMLKQRDVDVRRDTHEGVHKLRVAMRGCAARSPRSGRWWTGR